MRKNVLSFLLGLMLGMKLDVIGYILVGAVCFLAGLMVHVH